MEAKPVGRLGALELDLDLARAAGVVGRHRLQIGQRLLRALLDQLPRPHRRQHPRRAGAERALDRHRRQSLTEQCLPLAAGGLVAGDEQHRAAPRAAERRVDPGLAHLGAVEPEPLVVAPRDGVVHVPVLRPRHRVHADEERGVTALLEQLGIARPLLLDDPLAVLVQKLRHERVERPAAAGAVAVHDDDLGRPACLRAADGGVDLLGIELAALLVHRVTAARLLRLDDPGDALHVADDVDAHEGRLTPCGGDAQPECDEHDAGDRVERTPHTLAREHAPRPRRRDRVAGEPDARQKREEQAEPEQRRERIAELRQQAREEDHHLRVREVADEALAERAARRRARDRHVVGGAPAQRGDERLQPEIHQVGGADEPERRERRLRGPQDGDETGGGRDRPDGLAECDAERRPEAAAPAARERVPDRQRGVLSGSADDDCGDEEEAGQLSHAREHTSL